MFIRLNIIVCFLLVFANQQAFAQDDFKVFYPEYITAGGSFEISIITSKKSQEFEKLELFLMPEASLNIRNAELWINEDKSQIPIGSEFLTEFSESSKKISVDLSDTSIFSSESYFQLVIRLISGPVESNTLKFSGQFITRDGTVSNLVNSDIEKSGLYPDLFEILFSYYDRFYTADFAASFNLNAYLNLPLIYDFEESLVVEFWMKMKNLNSNFMMISNRETNRTEFTFSVNENQMLMINSRENDVIQMKPVFLSKNTWYHFSLTLNKNTSLLSLFCNDEESFKIKIANYFAYDNLVLHFRNEKPIGTFTIDQLRILSSFGSLAEIDRNRNYSDYQGDSSRVLLQLNFSESELNNLLNQKTVTFDGINFTKSTAPLFPRAPQISVKLLNNFYEVEWKGGDVKNANRYMLEKAVSNSDFEQIAEVPSENDDEKVYSLLTEKQGETEIFYFRIRQVNDDGSEVFSDVVKIGQGIVQDVIVGQNYPNPFNPTTLIDFELLQETDVEVKVYNLAGKEIAVLHKGFLSQGSYKFKFDATGLPSGIYIYQIVTPLSSQTRKMIFTK